MTRLVTGAALLAALAGLLGGCSDDEESPAATAGLPTRTVEAGEVTVEITPTSLDADAAVFDVTFDTHSVELDLDVAEGATLRVDGVAWTDATWDGAGPGGHHREGTLRFTAAGDPTGRAELRITGLDEPVVATWDLEDG